VSDSGIGIKPGDVEKLFRIDIHYTTCGTSSEMGTGLGLALCKEFVEKNNGRINVASEPGKGSTFFFTLPSSSSR
ncbi:MAG: sensor histidine kinase, partial [bacterium]|nr:sensor histidine kinase [bacterium]